MGGVAFELPRPREPEPEEGRAACEPADVLWPDATRCAVAKHENFFFGPTDRTHPLVTKPPLSLPALARENLWVGTRCNRRRA